MPFLILVIIICMIVALFAVQNAVAVSLNFVFWSFSASLVLVILGAFLMGVLVATCFLLTMKAKHYLKDKKMREEMQQLQAAGNNAGAAADVQRQQLEAQQKQLEEVRKQIENQSKAIESERKIIEEQRKQIDAKRKDIEEKEKKMIDFDVQLRKRKEQIDQLEKSLQTQGGGAAAAGELNKKLMDTQRQLEA